ncbi:DUF423 domain-containing protein [Ferruginivarius sediminum]|uniref:DUF423 domain-containing protein n=2 Tax=Ferruginivarius sediminum TaxID=2661937 RepID=A0A369T8K6_9PROT|nr:DUF423 domain-containing protein [Ferruginivarius sediminum]
MRSWLAIGAINGLLGVAIGAFAAHGLEGVLPDDRLEWVETAARYQLVHALALLVCAMLADRYKGRIVTVAGAAFTAGTLLFCGGLYVAGLTGWRAVIPVVPVGGACFLAGWAALLWMALRRPSA